MVATTGGGAQPVALEGGSNVVQIIPLGAGQEVGRSCIVLKYMGKSIMLDCGIHPGFSGMASLPYFDAIELEDVDAMLVTHFHLDHCAAVPFVTGHTRFRGRILMTHPTKAIYTNLLQDFVRVSRGGADEGLYSEQDLKNSLEEIETINFHQTVDIGGVKVTAYRAGHVLGAAMFMVEIAGMRCLYTGDYSRLADRHLDAADVPEMKPHIVIVEATYGVSNHSPREEREERFVEMIHKVVRRGGRVLLPVVALGRAQELLLILEQYWAQHPELHGVPIYQGSSLAKRAISVYQAYIDMMNDDIKKAFQASNPFVFKHVQHLKSASHFDDVGACVVMATPSMLQNGLSRDLFEAWCENPKNGIIIADFAVQGTLAREILGSPPDVMTKAGVKVPLRMSVEAISFSAHADFSQTSQFIEALAPPHVVLVHGEPVGMGRLKGALESQAKSQGRPCTLHTPKVATTVSIPHKAQRIAKVVGRLADKQAAPGAAVRGLLVRKNFSSVIMHPEDLPTFTKLHLGRILQRQALPLTRPFPEVRYALELTFEGVEGSGEMGGLTGEGKRDAVRVAEAVTVVRVPGRAGAPEHLVLEWEGGARGDMVADAVVATILQAAEEPAGLGAAEQARRQGIRDRDLQAVAEAEMRIIAALLNAQFGAARVDLEQEVVMVTVDQQHVVVDYRSGKVECSDEGLRGRVDKAVQRLTSAMRPVTMDIE